MVDITEDVQNELNHILETYSGARLPNENGPFYHCAENFNRIHAIGIKDGRCFAIDFNGETEMLPIDFAELRTFGCRHLNLGESINKQSTIRLTETQFKRLLTECVTKIINEIALILMKTNKEVVRFTESKLNKIIKESVKSVLNEMGDTHRGRYMIGRASARHDKNHKFSNDNLASTYHNGEWNPDGDF